jgi:hypothetical protein
LVFLFLLSRCERFIYFTSQTLLLQNLADKGDQVSKTTSAEKALDHFSCFFPPIIFFLLFLLDFPKFVCIQNGLVREGVNVTQLFD